MSYSPPGVVAPRRTRSLWSLSSPEVLGVEVRVVSANAAANNNYPAVNVALYIPFGLAEAVVVVKGWIRNGNAVAGNMDFGLYAEDGTKIVSKGSTAQAGIDVIQDMDITDTLLVPGNYYMAISSDTSGVTQKFHTHTAAIDDLWRACGIYQQATAFALPSPAVFAVCAQVQIPFFGFSARSLVA